MLLRLRRVSLMPTLVYPVLPCRLMVYSAVLLLLGVPWRRYKDERIFLDQTVAGNGQLGVITVQLTLAPKIVRVEPLADHSIAHPT